MQGEWAGCQNGTSEKSLPLQVVANPMQHQEVAAGYMNTKASAFGVFASQDRWEWPPFSPSTL